MATTVFYSWQSDSPRKVNRNFIEEALKRALRQITTEAEVINSPRGAGVVLDKDTAGLPGTPPIVDAIFNKIDQCSVFVPDLTFVAKTDARRPMPNANVLIEYGWALKSRGHERIVPVINDAFGEPTDTNLPFNMRHLRWPLRYTYHPDGDVAPTEIRNPLVDALKAAIGDVLRSVPSASVPQFEAAPSTHGKAVFFQQRATLATRMGRFSGADEKLSMPEQGAKIFIRLIPSFPTEQLLLRQAYDMIIEGRLEPFSLARIRGGGEYDMNRYGAIAYRATPDAPYIKHLTQLFTSRELWGVSCELMTDEYKYRAGTIGSDSKKSTPFLPAFYEDALIDGLDNYIRFAKSTLEVTLPLRVEGGITGIEGFRISAPSGMGFGGFERYGGRARVPEIIFKSMVRDWATPAKGILMPFFQRVWDGFSLKRPESAP